MSRSTITSHVEWIAPALLFVFSLVPRLLIALQSVPLQLVKMLPDDAYYYFLTAQNVLRGAGPSVDGVVASNGWHPLWLLINIGIFSLPVTDPDVFVKLSVATGAVLDSLVPVLLYLGTRRFVSRQAAFVGGAIYALNSMPVFQSVNGLETGLAALMLGIAWIATLRLRENPGTGRAVLWGVAFGLTFLARTDTSVVLIFLGFLSLFGLPKPDRWRLTISGAVAAFVIVLPWFVWNGVMFGSPLAQGSATAVPWAISARFQMTHPDASLLQLSLNSIAFAPTWLRGDYLGAPPIVGFLLWPLAFMGFWLKRATHSGRLVQVGLALLVGGVSLIVIHSMIRWYARPWYFVVNAQTLSLGLSLLWDAVDRPRLKLALAAPIAAACLVFGIAAWQIGYYPWQTRQIAGAEWIITHTEPDTVIGSMNSGIFGYYSQRRVVNLDGVVNPDAFAAIQESRLFDYMQSQNISYLIDSDQSIESEYGPFMGEGYPDGLEEVEKLGNAPYPALGWWRVYRVSSR